MSQKKHRNQKLGIMNNRYESGSVYDVSKSFPCCNALAMTCPPALKTTHKHKINKVSGHSFAFAMPNRALDPIYSAVYRGATPSRDERSTI